MSHHINSKPSFSRRSILRGVLGGLATQVALPFLPSLQPRSAWAQASLTPRRFVLFFWGNGVQPERWIPNETGIDWTPSPQLTPLASLRNRVSVLSGLEVKVGNTDAHISGPAGLLTGLPVTQLPGGDWRFQGETFDQRVAQAIGGDTLYRSLEVGVAPNLRGLSFNGAESRNPPETDPIRLYERLFGPTFRVPGDERRIDPRLGLRRSVLDAVLEDARSIRGRLSSADRARLDQHVSSVRDLELRLARLVEDPPSLEACIRPESPELLPDIDGRPQMEAKARVMAELSSIALACDLTRVLSFWFSDPLSGILYPNASAGHHQLTHDEPGDQPQVNEIILTKMRSLAFLLETLGSIPEGDVDLLHQCAVLATTDVSEGRTHQIDEYPILLAGQAGGTLKTGLHYRSSTKESTSHLMLSLLRALGIPAESYGEDLARVTSGLSAIEV